MIFWTDSMNRRFDTWFNKKIPTGKNPALTNSSCAPLSLFCSLFLLIFTLPSPSGAIELSGSVTLEGRFFSKSPAWPGQEHHNGSIRIDPELYHQFPAGSSLTIKPMVMLDSADSERSSADIREANFLYVADNWELLVGIGRVFWGATEFIHLVDIVNQSDMVQSLDGEEKLGQPMIHFSAPRDWGVVDAFVLPFFRERTYPGVDGRLRTPLRVDTDQTRYESGSGENHVDLALRYSHTLGDMDFGLYHFMGTSREPSLSAGLDAGGRPVLIPFYEQINQTGLDLQYVSGEWLWKGEALYRSGQGRNFSATTLGFEYTFTGIMNTSMDLGVIGEYVFDDRDEGAATPYNNDLMIGMRLAVNDAASTEILAGVIQDIDISSRVFTLEASRRFGDNTKLSLEAVLFADIDENDPLANLAGDDHIRIELSRFF